VHAVAADDGDGGAILNGGYFVGSGITVNNSVLSGNTCTNGDGGAFSNNAEATLSNCTFSGNICNSGYGGGVSDSYSAAFTNCTISGNTAGEGGGFFQYTDQAILTNCTIVGNAAPFGAGILNYAGIIAATNCTLSGNTASTGGGAGIFNDGFFGQAIATLTNCILYGDTGGEISNTDTLDVSYSDVQGGAAGTGNISSNPLLKSLGNYGGPTQTMALQAGSPCFGAGTASGAPTTDQRGMPRPNPPSMGAFDGNQSRFDFNGDGKDDLLWQNSQTGQLAVWDMNGMGISSTSVGNVFATINPIWKIKGVADINGDGHPDLLWWNSNTGQIIFWEMTGAQGTSQLYASPVVYTVPNTQWQPVSMADFDGDGHPDILWENMTTGQLIIWYMNGTTQKSATGVFATIPSDCRVAGTGDFNQDGHPDIVLESKTSGAIAIWYMGGTGGTTVLSKSGAFMTISNLSWQIVSTGDMDGDGHPDLTWHNTSTGQTIVWLMGGANGTTQLHAGAPLAASPKTTWSIVGVR
jgi:hypothetical protein